jgi:chlorobactene glucosyltransferase
MYGDFRSLWEGAARQAASLLGGTGVLLCVALGALLLVLASVGLPAWAACRLAWSPNALAIAALSIGGAGSLALLGTHVGAARYFRIPIWYGLLFPLGYAIGSGVLIFAAWERSHGQTRWKGRVYPAGIGGAANPIPASANEAAPT